MISRHDKRNFRRLRTHANPQQALIIILCCLGLFITPGAAQAIAIDWNAAVSGNWGTAGNWNPVAVPGTTDDVLISATGNPYTVTLDLNPTVNSFILNSADAQFISWNKTINIYGDSWIQAGKANLYGTTWNGNLFNAGELTLQSNTTINGGLLNSGSLIMPSGANVIFSGSVDNSGDITIDSGSSVTISGGTFNMAGGATFEGGGSINVRSNANLVLAGAYSNGASPLLIADNDTQVSGPGTLTNSSTLTLANGGAINTALVNNGVMEVQGDSYSAWVLDIGGPATNNGTINLNSYNNNTSLDNPVLNFHQGLVNNGTLVMRTGGNGTGSNSTTLSGGTSGTVSNSVGGTIDIQAGGNRYIKAHLNNQGTIEIAATTRFERNNGDYINDGSININAGGDLNVSAIHSWSGSGNLTGNGGNVIFSGNGSSAGSSWNNGGDLRLNSGNLTLQSFQNMANTGSIDVEDGVLWFNSNGSFDNSGDITIDSGSSVTISGGTFNMAGGATFEGGGSINVRSNANLVLAGAYSNGASPLLIADNDTQVSGPGTLTNSSTLTLANGGAINTALVNNGVMEVQGDSYSAWVLDIGGPATNNGTINLNSYNNNTSLDNPVLNFHQGLVNNGTLVMRTGGNGTGSNSTTLNIGTGSVLVNQGMGHIIMEGGGNRIINGTVANKAKLSVATNITMGTADSDHTNSGTLILLDDSTATILGNSFTNQAGGLLGGNGTFNASTSGIVNEGTVAPGESPGLLTITGDFIQRAGGILDIELSGLIAGSEFDRLTVSGTANLAGILNVSLLDGFDPILGNSFDFLLAGNILGDFDQVLLPSLSGKIFDLSFTDTTASLTVVASPVPLPPSLYMFGLALLALGAYRTRKTVG